MPEIRKVVENGAEVELDIDQLIADRSKYVGGEAKLKEAADLRKKAEGALQFQEDWDKAAQGDEPALKRVAAARGWDASFVDTYLAALNGTGDPPAPSPAPRPKAPTPAAEPRYAEKDISDLVAAKKIAEKNGMSLAQMVELLAKGLNSSGEATLTSTIRKNVTEDAKLKSISDGDSGDALTTIGEAFLARRMLKLGEKLTPESIHAAVQEMQAVIGRLPVGGSLVDPVLGAGPMPGSGALGDYLGNELKAPVKPKSIHDPAYEQYILDLARYNWRKQKLAEGAR